LYLSSILNSIASGALLTYTWDEEAPLASRLCTGACIGFALLALIGFVLALLIGLTTTTLVVTALLLATPALLLRPRRSALKLIRTSRQTTRAIRPRDHLRRIAGTVIYLLFYAMVAIVMWLVFSFGRC